MYAATLCITHACTVSSAGTLEGSSTQSHSTCIAASQIVTCPNDCQLCCGASGITQCLPATACFYRRHIQSSDMSCNRLSGSCSRRHESREEAFSCIFARVGCTVPLEPSYTFVNIAAAGGRLARTNIGVNVLSPHGPTLLDISMMNPRCPPYVAAAYRLCCPAAALRDRGKYRVHAGHLHTGQTFMPASAVMHGHVGKPIMLYTSTLIDIAVELCLMSLRGRFSLV
jgi:hypothetical protein